MNAPFDIPLELQQILTHKGYSCDRDGVLMLWQKAQKDLSAAKAFEMDIRKIAVKLTVTDPKEGMNTVELGNGYVAKAAIKYNYKLKDNDTVEASLAAIAKVGNEGSFIADRLVSWTPNFLLTEYRALQEECEKDNPQAKQIMKHINDMLIIDEAAPTLEIKEPKEKKK